MKSASFPPPISDSSLETLVVAGSLDNSVFTAVVDNPQNFQVETKQTNLCNQSCTLLVANPRDSTTATKDWDSNLDGKRNSYKSLISLELLMPAVKTFIEHDRLLLKECVHDIDKWGRKYFRRYLKTRR